MVLSSYTKKGTSVTVSLQQGVKQQKSVNNGWCSLHQTLVVQDHKLMFAVIPYFPYA